MDRWASSTPFTERAVDYEIEGDDGTFGTYETKKAAVAAGREQAMKRKTEHVDRQPRWRDLGAELAPGNDPADRFGVSSFLFTEVWLVVCDRPERCGRVDRHCAAVDEPGSPVDVHRDLRGVEDDA